MKLIISRTLIGIFLLASFSVLSQDREERSLDSFSKMRVGEGIKVELKKGTSEKAIIEVRGLDVDGVVTEIRGGSLNIYLDGNWHRNIDVSIELTYKSLNSITISSAGNVRTNEAIESDDLYISASSAGGGDIEVKVKELELEASSAGTLDVYGSTIELEAAASSAGSIDAYDLKAEEVVVRASSAGSIKVQATKLIDARASSGGSIRYRGNPSKEYTNSSSGGSVRKSG
jgi:hypothetical protein